VSMANGDRAELDLSDPTLLLPERVALRHRLGGIGARALAYLVDSLVRALFLLGLFALAQIGSLLSPATWGLSAEGVLVFLAVGFFLVNWAYFVSFETAWGGQTPGKRAMGLRVESLDGLRPRFWQAAVRNLLRVVDVFPWGYGLGLAAVFLSRRGQRLGDTAAGTVVVAVAKPLEEDERRFALVDDRAHDAPPGADVPYAHWELLQEFREWAAARGEVSEPVAREVVRTLWAALGPEARESLRDIPAMAPARALETLHGYLLRG
jgi:uncharacterized RDD family membrane protein YckC